jgi:hypothetical protein
MATYSISQFNFSDDQILEIYEATKESYADFDFGDLDVIFSICLNSKQLFPSISLPESRSNSDYIKKWVKGYFDAQIGLPSRKLAKSKGSCTDPVIRFIVQEVCEFSEEESIKGERIHNLFMSAENIQGNLLEEYISREVRSYGWIWCNGNVMRSIDFCNLDGSALLQIKNKSNTENSSSSAIRIGTKINKWHRLSTQTKSGIKIPSYRWEKLNDMINQDSFAEKDEKCNMSEEDYIAFLKSVISENKKLITD